MKTVADSMKGYYSDKSEHPWNKVNRNIQKFIKQEKSTERLSEIIILMRTAVFGALDILSFGLIHQVTTEDIIDAFTKEKSWKLGRRSARNLCLDIADKLIEKNETRYFVLSAIKREGFGFLLHRIEESQFDEFKKAKPKIVKNKLDLTKLEKSVLGSRFLREQMVMETKIDAKDPRTAQIIEAYDLQLVETELEQVSRVKPPTPTEQVTLNGQPVFDDDEKDEEKVKRKIAKSDQIALTDFITEEKKQVKKPKKKSSKKKGGRKSE
jgi:hypothetical protein